MNAAITISNILQRNSGGGASPLTLVFDSETISFTPDEAEANPGANQTVMSRLLYDNGKTYYVYAVPQDTGKDQGKQVIITYDDGYGVGRPVGFANQLVVFDYHHIPVLIKDNNRLYVAVEQNHNIDGVGILKTRTDGDSYVFEITGSEMDNDPSYPKLYKRNGVFVNIMQYGDHECGFNKNVGSGFDGTWSVEAKIAVRGASELDLYTYYIINNGVAYSDEVVSVIVGRGGSEVYFNKYVVRSVFTSSGVTHYNWNYSFSTTTTITAAEMAAHFLYYSTGGNTKQGFGVRPSMDWSGNFYDLSGDGVGGYDFIYQLRGDSAPTIKALSLPGSPIISDPPDGHESACAQIIAISPSEVYGFFLINDGSFVKIYQYKTEDLGDTWILIGDVFSDIDDNFQSIQFPTNLYEVGNNQNSIVVAKSQLNPTYSSIYIKKFAFGAIQPETNDPYNVTPYTEAEYNALMSRSYFVEAGKLTNSGTNGLTLTDQSSSGQNCTLGNNPQLDNATTPTQLTFNGTNQYGSIPITGLTGLTEGTVIGVFKVADGVGGTLLSASNNTVANKFFTLGKRPEKTSRIQMDAGSLEIWGDDVLSSNFHIMMFVFQNGGGWAQQWVDGKLQKREASARYSDEGKFFSSIGLTHLEIARLVRTTTAYSAPVLKHLAISSTPFNFEQIQRSMKLLSNKYSITLNSHFQ